MVSCGLIRSYSGLIQHEIDGTNSNDPFLIIPLGCFVNLLYSYSPLHFPSSSLVMRSSLSIFLRTHPSFKNFLFLISCPFLPLPIFSLSPSFFWTFVSVYSIMMHLFRTPFRFRTRVVCSSSFSWWCYKVYVEWLLVYSSRPSVTRNPQLFNSPSDLSIPFSSSVVRRSIKLPLVSNLKKKQLREGAMKHGIDTMEDTTVIMYWCMA